MTEILELIFYPNWGLTFLRPGKPLNHQQSDLTERKAIESSLGTRPAAYFLFLNSLSQSLYFHFFMLLVLYLCLSCLGWVFWEKGEGHVAAPGPDLIHMRWGRREAFGESSRIHLHGLLLSFWSALLLLALSWKPGGSAGVWGPAFSLDVRAGQVAGCGPLGPWCLEVQVGPILVSWGRSQMKPQKRKLSIDICK